ncbi:MAG: hypothetical protein COA79_08015 [Planctomycetota bacterium]|nr:MAG: hypothetical protein COA79_08015 [Planctomycetota bacterium]
MATGISGILDKINKIDKVLGCIISSYDGIILDSSMREGSDPEFEAGIGSHKVSRIKDTFKRLEFGEIEQITLYGKEGNQCIYDFNGNILLINCHKNANINFIGIEVEPFVEEIKKVLAG